MRQVRLEFSQGTSDKFWEGTATGTQVSVTFGRKGTAGQQKSWQFATQAEAIAHLEKSVKEKSAKGYVSIFDVNFAAEEENNSSASAEESKGPEPEADTAASKEISSQLKKAPIPQVTMPQECIDLNERERCYPIASRKAPLAISTTRRSFEELKFTHSAIHSYSLVEQCLKEMAEIGPWSKEEAHDWFYGMITRLGPLACRAPGIAALTTATGTLLEKSPPVIEKTPLSEYTVETARSAISDLEKRNNEYWANLSLPFSFKIEHCYALAVPLLFLLPLNETLEVWKEFWHLEPLHPNKDRFAHGHLIAMLRQAVPPYITGEDLANLRRYLATKIKSNPFRISSPADEIPLEYLMAGLAGMEDLVRPVVEAIPDDFYVDASPETGLGGLANPSILMFAFTDPEEVFHHFNRTKLALFSKAQCLAWLNIFGTRRISPVVAFAREYGLAHTKEKYFWKFADEYLGALLRIKSTEAAREIFLLSMEPVYRQPCLKWLNDNPAFTIEALLGLVSENHKSASQARTFITDMIKTYDETKVPAALLQACDAMHNEAVAQRAALSTNDRPEWLTELFRFHKPKQRNLPIWLAGAVLPPIIIEGYCLSEDEVTKLLHFLKGSWEKDLPLALRELREAVPRQTFDKFVWDLLQRWLVEGAPPNEKWCMLAVGILGSDNQVAALLPLMKEWRAGSNASRAKYGLECIKASGTDASLMLIHKISNTSSLKSLRSHAQMLMKTIAYERKLTPLQLEDRIVPTCGIEDGQDMIFDFGPRSFRLVLGNDLKPYIRDASGKTREDLPAANSDDDQAMAATAITEWKTLKKTIKPVAKAQAKRLEMAMVSGRRWTTEEFQTLFVNHPILVRLCRSLVWAVYNKNERVASTFRITDENDFSDVEDKVFTIPTKEQIGIVHPLQLDSKTILQWGQLQSEYDLAPPFAQLARCVPPPPEDDIKQNKISLFKDLEIEAIFIPSILGKLDWENLPTEGGGVYFGHFKYFPGKDITVIVNYEGIYIGDPKSSEPQQIESVLFASGDHSKSSYFGVGASADSLLIPLKAVDPIILAEVYSDLNQLAAKGKKLSV